MPPSANPAALRLCAAWFCTAIVAMGASPTFSTARAINPDMLSGGLFSALDAEGAFGSRPPPRRARADGVTPTKGRPPVVLDARVGANLRLGDDPAALPATQRGQAEPHIYRNALNPDILLACFQEGRFVDGGSLDCGYSVSKDGGLTWTRALIPNLTTTSGGTFNRATDPVAAIGPQGDMYLNTLGSISGVFDVAAVVVSRSTDNGATWTNPITIYRAPNTLVMPDKNWFVVNDLPNAPHSGRLVATWTNFTSAVSGNQTVGTGDNILAAVSDDRGDTWTSPIAVTPAGSLNQGSQPVFLPDGSLVIVYITFANANTTTNITIQSKRSADGGLTYPATASTIAAVSAWDDPDVRDGVFLPAATASRTTGEIFVTYTAVINGSPRVMFAKSSDQAATWSTPIAISDQPAGVSVMNPTIVVTPDGRTVTAVWMDKRNASDGHNFVDHYAALSFDGGATWQPNVRLTDLTSDIRYAANTTRGYMLGDYLGVAPALAPNQPCVAIWCDTRTGDADPFTVRFTPTATVDYNAWAIARGTTGATLLADTDNDNEMDRVEYLTGSDPRKVDTGERFVILRSAPNTVDIAWTQRAGVTDSIAIPIIASDLGLQFGSGGLGATQPLNIADTVLPTVPAPPGLVWHSARQTLAPGDARAVTFAVRFSAGFGMLEVGSPVSTLNTDSRLINLSTRGRVDAGDNQMIVGFVVDGAKSVLVRAAGPALATFGVAGTLANPQLTVQTGSTVIASNDDWSQGNATSALFSRLGAFPFTAGSLDAAVVSSLTARGYTAVVSGVNGGAGVALVEAWDADPKPGAVGNPRLLNVSTRANAGSGDNALIAGFALTGTQPRRVLIRAVGPSLAAFGVNGVLADPVLTLYRNGTALAANDDWEISRSGAAVAATAQRVGAFALNSASLDAALLLTLAPGTYSAVVTSANGGTGIALVEVYDAD